MKPVGDRLPVEGVRWSTASGHTWSSKAASVWRLCNLSNPGYLGGSERVAINHTGAAGATLARGPLPLKEVLYYLCFTVRSLFQDHTARKGWR